MLKPNLLTDSRKKWTTKAPPSQALACDLYIASDVVGQVGGDETYPDLIGVGYVSSNYVDTNIVEVGEVQNYHKYRIALLTANLAEPAIKMKPEHMKAGLYPCLVCSKNSDQLLKTIIISDHNGQNITDISDWYYNTTSDGLYNVWVFALDEYPERLLFAASFESHPGRLFVDSSDHTMVTNATISEKLPNQADFTQIADVTNMNHWDSGNRWNQFGTTFLYHESYQTVSGKMRCIDRLKYSNANTVWSYGRYYTDILLEYNEKDHTAAHDVGVEPLATIRDVIEMDNITTLSHTFKSPGEWGPTLVFSPTSKIRCTIEFYRQDGRGWQQQFTMEFDMNTNNPSYKTLKAKCEVEGTVFKAHINDQLVINYDMQQAFLEAKVMFASVA